jgi:acyl-CoA reductase-like NAD-dependent aldehyde dehydrogenase
MATQTVIVHESAADSLLALLFQKAASVTASSIEDENANLRGVFTKASAERVREITKDALDKGAEVAAGKVGVEGNVVQPLLLKGVTSAMSASSRFAFFRKFAY